ncbi:MAG: squalene synthase HpnC [Burkholderiales bacterium]|jgi:squalene synthase HpnC|nr:squalene synthase HpnC [Burkholderiales bacterium]
MLLNHHRLVLLNGYLVLPVDHYENFPIASIILPKHLRAPIETIYNFARSADDIADSRELPATFKQERLGFFREELQRIQSDHSPLTPLFSELALLIAQHNLPITLFFQLLDAFEQDLTIKRYENFAQLRLYCNRSANPVGRILLHLFGHAQDDNLQWSDSICTSLQIINFLQDITDDYEMGRIYLPQDEMDSFGVTEHHIKNKVFDLSWLNFMDFQINRARQYLDDGSALYDKLPGRMGIEIKTIVKSGLQVTKKLSASRGNVFAKTHKINSLDFACILFQTIFRN